MTIAALILWWIVGIAGFIHWWTKDFNFIVVHIPLALIFGTMGPIAWFVGWVVHGDHYPPRERKSPKILIKQRKQS